MFGALVDKHNAHEGVIFLTEGASRTRMGRPWGLSGTTFEQNGFLFGRRLPPSTLTSDDSAAEGITIRTYMFWLRNQD